MTAWPVPAVACLGQRVWPERGELLRLQELVEPACVDDVIEIVRLLTALVPQPAVLLEAGRPSHNRRLSAADETRHGGAEAPPCKIH